MATDKARTNRPAEFSQNSSGVAQNLDPGPFVGIVKNNVDPQRMGRLQIWIPYLTPDETNSSTWFTVSYASPFYGFTAPEERTDQNSFDKTKHSYGMWFVPPDLGVKVLVTFANGDPNKGYWFACIPEGHSHVMVPSLGASKYSDFRTSSSESSIIPEDSRPDIVPVVEYNENNVKLDVDVNWYQKSLKPLHQEQFKQLQQQGLAFDYLRGSILSSSQRETPSQTFGISTPGRPLAKNAQGIPTSRKGGHSFVMDDGDIFEGNNFIRLKTGKGHQILMNDTEDFIYISNNNGTAWLEINRDGDIEIYCNGKFSLRSSDTINLHSDGDINMYAGGKITTVAEQGIDTQAKYLHLNSLEQTTIHACQALNLKSGTTFASDAGTTFTVSSKQNTTIRAPTINLNTGSAPNVPPLEDIPRQRYPNALRNQDTWKSVPNRIQSVATRVPTHEPDVGHLSKLDQIRNPNVVQIAPSELSGLGTQGVVPQPPVTAVRDSQGNAVLTQNGAPLTTGTASQPVTGAVSGQGGRQPGADATVGLPVTGIKSDYNNLSGYLQRQPDPAAAVGTLTRDETKALFAGVGLSESTHNYTAVNQLGYVGKYQFGAAALVDQGYINREYYQRYGPSNEILKNPAAWTGKDGVTSREGFLAAPAVQEKVMQSYSETNYRQLVRNGGIKPTDDKSTVAGMLQTAHLLGAGGAANWRKTGQGSDANNVTGGTYFNRGRYAVETLTRNGSFV
jgi:hypothetical protein